MNNFEANSTPLTELQRRFVAEYLIDANASAAAKRAGSSAQNLASAGHSFLQVPAVRDALELRQDEMQQKLQINQERILTEIVNIAFFDPGPLWAAGIRGPRDLAALPKGIRSAIVGWTWDREGNFIPKLADKGKALDQLARFTGLYNDRLDVTVTDGLAERVARAKARSSPGEGFAKARFSPEENFARARSSPGESFAKARSSPGEGFAKARSSHDEIKADDPVERPINDG